MNKELLRKEFLKKRDSLNSQEILKKSRLIREKLLDLEEFKEAEVMLFYVSFRSEVKTEEAIKEALRQGKKVLIPLVSKEECELKLYKIENFESDLEPGYMGILEPKKERTFFSDLALIDLIVVPGCAFDLKGYRLGYGGGFFDRLLQKTSPKTKIIGLAFEIQVVGELPREPHDIPLDKIITEKRIITP